MLDYGLPALFAVLVWWFATGVILWLDGLPRATHRWSMLAISAISLAAGGALWASADDTSVTGAYVGFTATVLLWAWLEMSFLMGYVTGPRREEAGTPATDAGPAAASWQGGWARAWRRFAEATQTVIYHELAIAAVGAGVFAVSGGAANAVGWWTFAVLWAMRLSAKLNLFLGVPNVNAELLPEHLQYLRGYFRKKSMNWLFPLSVSAAAAVAGWLALELATLTTGSAAAVAQTLALALLVLAILEHGFMVLPLPVNELWRWAMAGPTPPAAARTTTAVDTAASLRHR